ncbi:MAG: sugar phosphate isomerase/epimerase [Spirochaetales bacterium]|nr:sugar phosphate isomerase/epimerase [Spirochaetales bacterium]
MATQIKGPGVFLAQFITDSAPRNSLEGLAEWASGLGFRGVQLPAWDQRIIDLDQAAASQDYCDELKGRLAAHGLEITELFALQGQMMAIHPALAELFAGFHPPLEGAALVEWAQSQVIKAIDASARLGLKGVPVLSGTMAWIMVYPWPQRPAGIVETSYRELARRWRPVLDHARDKGLTVNFELHPGDDLFDGATFDMFLEYTDQHPAACINYDPSHFLLQQLDLYGFIETYGSRIRGFHVKDAEFNPSARQGVYSGMQPWARRAGRFRTVGDGQVDFRRVFTLLTQVGFDGWAVLEWEDPIRSADQAARIAARFIEERLIETAQYAFDDFAGSAADPAAHRRILGIED